MKKKEKNCYEGKREKKQREREGWGKEG